MLLKWWALTDLQSFTFMFSLSNENEEFKLDSETQVISGLSTILNASRSPTFGEAFQIPLTNKKTVTGIRLFGS